MTLPEIGVFLPTMTVRSQRPGDVAAAARHAEQLGFESVWVVDQLVAGTGVPVIESIVALSAAAGATERIRLGLGVLVVPLRPAVWIAKQVASLQYVSGGRVLFGVGVGGDRHEQSWAAAGVPRAERGARTDAALAVVRDLIAGRPVSAADPGDGASVVFAPGVEVPPIIVGGGPAAIDRTVRWADGWFALPAPPAVAEPVVAELRSRSAALGRDAPALTGSIVVALEGDPARPTDDEIVRQLADPDGVYGMPAEAIPSMLVTTADQLVERVQEWTALGAERVVFTLAAGDWEAQATLLRDALRRLGPDQVPAEHPDPARLTVPPA